MRRPRACACDSRERREKKREKKRVAEKGQRGRGHGAVLCPLRLDQHNNQIPNTQHKFETNARATFFNQAHTHNNSQLTKLSNQNFRAIECVVWQDDFMGGGEAARYEL